MDPVLVVGAGPTGLMAALELAARRVPVRIIDKAALRSDRSRALVVQARSLELLARHGLADELVARGRTVVRLAVFVGARPALEAELSDIGADDTPYPFLLFVSQAETERLLERALAGLGVTVERPLALVDLRDDGDAVRATLSSGETISVPWVVGADGAHSAVRHAAGLEFAGAAYEQDFVLADVHLDWEQAGDRIRFFLADDGLLVVFPFQEPGLYRLIASQAGRAPDAPDEPDLGEVQALATRLAPLPLRLHDPVWLARFRLHHRGVDRYRAGRVFVAGDAAHIHSPAGGQGMNTGLQDAVNLAWKLALVVGGRAPERLLDSYQAERHPVGKRLLATTDQLFRIGASRSRFMLRLRNLFAPTLASFVLRTPARRARAFRFISELAISYPKSPIVGEEGRWRGGPAAGARAPDAPLGESTLFARMAGVGHHLLCFDGAEPPELGRFADLIEVVSVPRTAQVARTRYGVDGPALYVVRPDGYVGWRGHDTAALARWLGETYR